MNSVVVDTDVFSFLFKNDSRAESYRRHVEGKILALSFMSVAELYRWAYLKNWGNGRISRLEERLKNFVIIPYDHNLCMQWAAIKVERERKGNQISCQDAWIAACALRHDSPLVTHNQKDFDDIDGLTVICEV